MAQGLQVWGPDGTLWVDTNSNLSRIYGSASLGPNAGSQSLSGMAGQGTLFAIAPDPEVQTTTHSGMTIRAPVAGWWEFSGTDIDYVYPFTQYVNPYTFVYYGAF